MTNSSPSSPGAGPEVHEAIECRDDGVNRRTRDWYQCTCGEQFDEEGEHAIHAAERLRPELARLSRENARLTEELEASQKLAASRWLELQERAKDCDEHIADIAHAHRRALRAEQARDAVRELAAVICYYEGIANTTGMIEDWRYLTDGAKTKWLDIVDEGIRAALAASSPEQGATPPPQEKE